MTVFKGARLLGGVFLLTTLVFCTSREERVPEERPRSRPAAAPKSIRPEPRTPESTWEQMCQRCHAREELAGKTAEDIRDALGRVPTMRRFQGRLTEEEIEALARLLPTAGAASSDTASGADDGG